MHSDELSGLPRIPSKEMYGINAFPVAMTMTANLLGKFYLNSCQLGAKSNETE